MWKEKGVYLHARFSFRKQKKNCQVLFHEENLYSVILTLEFSCLEMALENAVEQLRGTHHNMIFTWLFILKEGI